LCRNGLLRHFVEGKRRKGRREGKARKKLSTCKMTVRKQEDAGN
jgi:hypothetical protein